MLSGKGCPPSCSIALAGTKQCYPTLELKMVPGVCHKKKTARFCDTDGKQDQQLDAPGHLR